VDRGGEAPRLARRTDEAFVSFDGAVSATGALERPDRYRFLEAADPDGPPRIARGGGYSYAAASFGAGCVVQDLRRFNRILRFDVARRLIEVEGGLTLGDAFAVTAREGLGLAAQPGYPAITVGGSIATSAHGKNPVRDGTFVDAVADLTLFHPAHGAVRISREVSPEVFELTCGGYGLTGTIVSATLRLEPSPGRAVSIRRFDVGSPAEALPLVRELAGSSLFAYSWHDAAPASRTFGRGFVYQGTAAPAPPAGRADVPAYRVLTPAARARLPFSLWRGPLARAFTSGYWHVERRRPERGETSAFDAIFPFARRASYFRLYGRPGLAECQILVPHDRAEGFLDELRRLVLAIRPPSVMLSVKAFEGAPRLLRFQGRGACITLDLARSASTLELLRRVDELTIAARGLPHIAKDSRLPRAVVQACYAEYEPFRKALSDFDPRRLYRSELSERLGL
jgi:decaprenylphospho-beta-D-ribofuranose 2-oxidase